MHLIFCHLYRGKNNFKKNKQLAFDRPLVHCKYLSDFLSNLYMILLDTIAGHGERLAGVEKVKLDL